MNVSDLRQTNKKLNNKINNLIKRLLNDPVINDTRWPINKQVKQKTILRSNSKAYLNDPTLIALLMIILHTITMVRPSVSTHETHPGF